MTSRMRASVPQGRVYTSKTPSRQVPLKKQRPRNLCQHAVFATRPSTRQETLTQIGFVSSPRSLEDYDKEVDEHDIGVRRSKRRRLNNVASDSTYHTQTLTQFDFTSIPQYDAEIEDKENIGSNAYWQDHHHRSPAREQASVEKHAHPSLPSSPRTPRHSNITEIPSSQSPVTPFSCQHNQRFSLARCDIYKSQDLLQRSPSQSAIRPSPRLKVEDTFDDDSQRTLQTRFSSPIPNSSPSRQLKFRKPAATMESLCATYQLPRLDQKREIEDSEAGSAEEDDCDGPDADVSQGLPLMTVKSFVQTTTPRGDDSHISRDEGFARLSTQVLAAMAPRSDRSDVFISMHPNDLNGIVCGSTRRVFRNHPLPTQAKRIWVYETGPASQLSHMAYIREATCPRGTTTTMLTHSEAQTCDRSGHHSYELQQMYRLANPITLADLKLRQWLKGPPQTHIYVPPAVLDALMANLERPIFTTSESSQTESQEAEAQLQNNILQFSDPTEEAETNGQFLSERRTTDVLDISENSIHMFADEAEIMRSSQATTIDLSPTSNMPEERTNMAAPLPVDESFSAPCQWQQHIVPDGKSPLAGRYISQRLLPDSSQILTRSQMLPDSLLSDSVPLPRLRVDDSQEDA